MYESNTNFFFLSSKFKMYTITKVITVMKMSNIQFAILPLKRNLDFENLVVIFSNKPVD